MKSFQRGTLDAQKTALTGTASQSQDWDFDPLGNWDSVTTDGTTQTRAHNKQNEITSVSGATNPTFDASGNMTTDETGKQFVYDAWNRLVTVKNSVGTVLKTYAYDGLNRRVSETASSTTTDLFYSSQWQVLEEKVGSNTTNRYVWSPVYVDALVLRDRDTNGDGTLDERLWVIQDANYNVTALINGSGAVVERHVYTPFGVQSMYNASYVGIGSSAYSMSYGFQGRPLDDVSGNIDNRGRWYRPTLGRPITMDPIRYAAGDVNLYRWELNDPISGLDPSGNAPVDLKEIKNLLRKCPAAKELLDKATADKVYIRIGYVPNADFDPRALVIRIPFNDPTVQEGASSLLFELLRYKHLDEQRALDKKAAQNLISKEDYTVAAEKITFKVMKEHRDIMSACLDKGSLVSVLRLKKRY